MKLIAPNYLRLRVDEIDPWSQFHQRAFFLRKFVQSQTLSSEKLLNLLSYKKCERKRLMKLTLELLAAAAAAFGRYNKNSHAYSTHLIINNVSDFENGFFRVGDYRSLSPSLFLSLTASRFLFFIFCFYSLSLPH